MVYDLNMLKSFYASYKGNGACSCSLETSFDVG